MHALSPTFSQQPNSRFKSGIKALPSRYLLVQCQPAMETPEQCEVCSKLTVKTQIQLTVNIFHTFFGCLHYNINKDTRTTYIKMILEYVLEAQTKGVAGGVVRSPLVNIFQRLHHC